MDKVTFSDKKMEAETRDVIADIQQVSDALKCIAEAMIEVGLQEDSRESEENAPHTPLKEDKEKKEEAPSSFFRRARIRAKRNLSADIIQQFIEKQPEDEQGLVTGEEFLEYCREHEWLDRLGQPIRSWRLELKKWLRYRRDMRNKQQLQASKKNSSKQAKQLHEIDEDIAHRIQLLNDGAKNVLASHMPRKQQYLCRTGNEAQIFRMPDYTLELLRAEFGDDVAELWLEIQLADLARSVGWTRRIGLKNIQQLSTIMAHEYSQLKMVEIMLFMYRIKLGKYGDFYDRPTLLRINQAMQQFMKFRMQFFN